jgi:hypothetical protein
VSACVHVSVCVVCASMHVRVRVCKYACESKLSIYREHVLSIECVCKYACESTLSDTCEGRGGCM